ncbi:glycosyltransferase family 2 protein [Gallaecimonas pentaromativorans]|uniref:Glycosyltransferase n=1 Tax=Gallaecimonas pentaromativorans TaxID=584787 RepID=A0A3N1P241_9GAMM|nr:glycosyltransferase family 2 protein [Gallaecimonas pentaromativorans]ROQ22525.1 glycosyltransferase [Gallaecimonas pentaromativorans]
MKISVITATWNSGRTIASTLDSLAAQSYKDVELIVIDGASSDDTVEIIKSRKDIDFVLISEPDNGIYDALNKGILKASGDVVGFLHSDDFFSSPNVLTEIAAEFERSGVDAVYGDLEYVAQNNVEKVIRLWRSGLYSKSKIVNGWMPPHPTFYMRRNKYLELGAFDLRYRIAADYESILRYLWKANVSVAYIPKVLVKMRVGGESNRSFMNIIKKSKEDWQAMKENDLPALRAILGKNLSKISQFFARF